MDGLERDFGSRVQVERFAYGLGKRKGKKHDIWIPSFLLKHFHDHAFVIYCEERPSLGSAKKGGR